MNKEHTLVKQLTQFLSPTRTVVILGSANAEFMVDVINACFHLECKYKVLLNKKMGLRIAELCKESFEKKVFDFMDDNFCFFNGDRFDLRILESQIIMLRKFCNNGVVLLPYSREDDEWVNIWDVACCISDEIVFVDRFWNLTKKNSLTIPWYKYQKVQNDVYHTGYFIDKFNLFPAEMDLVVVGTTHAHFAIDADMFSNNVANMAVFLNGLLAQKLILEKYRYRIVDNAIVLLTVEYPIFLVEREWSCCNENKYIYSKLSLASKLGFSSEEQELYNSNPESFFSKSLFDRFIVDSIRNETENNMSFKERKERIDSLIEGWEIEVAPIPVRDYKRGSNFEIVKKRKERSVNSYIEMIRFCVNNGWRPILVGLPYSQEVNDSIPESFISECFYHCIEEIIKETNVPFIDYSKDKEFALADDYMDVWFLNNKGRTKFAHRVNEDIRNTLNF